MMAANTRTERHPAPTPAPAPAPAPARNPRWRALYNGQLGALFVGTLSVLCGLLIWQVLSRFLPPLFLPSPWQTWQGAVELWSDGTLQQATLASLARILAGWVAGLAVGVPLGVLMGYFPLVRRALEPYVEFFRFIPPIAFVTLAVIWLGPGEISKVALIFYTTVFIVMISTIAGVVSVNPLRIRAAETLGANRWQILRSVIVPSAVPQIITGARVAMGNSFLTIVSAEIVAAQVGIGAVIWTARNYGKTEWVFVGIIVLGMLGFLCDRVLRLLVSRLLRRYDVNL